MTEAIGAAPHERSVERDRAAQWSPNPDADHNGRGLELRIPKLRTGSFFPSLLERRPRVDQALFTVVMEAYLHGVSTRKVDDWSKHWARMSVSPIPKSAGSAPTSMPR